MTLFSSLKDMGLGKRTCEEDLDLLATFRWTQNAEGDVPQFCWYRIGMFIHRFNFEADSGFLFLKNYGRLQLLESGIKITCTLQKQSKRWAKWDWWEYVRTLLLGELGWILLHMPLLWKRFREDVQAAESSWVPTILFTGMRFVPYIVDRNFELTCCSVSIF